MTITANTDSISSKDKLFKSSIRRAVVEDIPWLVSVGNSSFDDIDKEDTSRFLYFAMQTPSFLVLRDDHAFGCCYWEYWPFNNKVKKAYEVFLATDGHEGSVWQANSILKSMIDWARKQNCDSFRLESQTKYDLAPIAKRNGFVPQHEAYILNLKPVH